MSDLVNVIEIVGRVVFGLGALLLFGSVLPSAASIEEWVTSRVFARTPVVNCGGLDRNGRLPRRAAVRGKLSPTGGDALTAPLSQTPCVWYQLKVLRSYRDSEGNETTETLWQYSSSDTVALHDETGTVGVSWKLFQRNIRGERFDGLIESPDLPDSAGPAALEDLGLVARGTFTGSSDAVWVTEQIIAPGEAVLVMGKPTRQPHGVVLHRPLAGWSGVSRLSMPDLRAEAAAEVADTLSLVRFLVLPGVVLGVLGGCIHWLASFLMVRVA